MSGSQPAKERIVHTAKLNGKIKNIGPLNFVCVEWWGENTRFVLLRYSINDEINKLGLRLDLDKKVILDDLDDPELNRAVRGHMSDIWAAAVAARAEFITKSAKA
jgi:hypothetical protein